MNKIDRLRKETYDDLKQNLAKYGKCALIRPTGFGKTGLLTKLLGEYKNVIFLYPAEVVRDAVHTFYGDINIPNTRFITYSKLVNLSKEDMKAFGDVDLIICDECHRLGATRTYRALNKLIKVFPKTHLVGATATPDRMDLVDEIGDFFEDHVVFEYTLHDAFQDGILHRPYYCFCTHGVEDVAQVEKETRLEIEKMDEDRDEAEAFLRARLVEISNLQNMDKVIHETCEEHLDDTSYLKFIVFFADFKHMSDKGDDVKSWFSESYPNHTLDTLIVSSETEEYAKNTANLKKLIRKEDHIDLIFCVDMMNMGYHVDDLTGIVMYRGTQSGIIFSQQLGRVLSSGSCKSGIVFDVVDNLHRESVYEVLGCASKETKKRRARLERLQKKKEKLESEGLELSEKEQEELNILIKATTSNKWWTHANDLQPADLIVTGHEATYREIISKTVAEPKAMRCRQAYKRWKERGGKDNPYTREFVLSQKAPEAVPLAPYCELKSVTIQEVLKVMGL